MIVILGAGLAGLSAAYHLKGREYRLFEKEQEAGGLCRSMVQNGFTFDYSGHLLSTQHPYTQKLLDELIPNTLVSHQRHSVIYLKGRYIPYPFQANLWALPKEIIKECVLGFIRAYCDDTQGGDDFLSWIYKTFGPGIAKHFMVPYNEKLWRIPLQDVSLEWVEKFIPRPTLEEMIDGTLRTNVRGFGYNQEFLYPIDGGIQVLPQAFLPLVENIQLGKEAKSIDIEKRVVIFQDDTEVSYRILISSIPLDELLQRIVPLPEEIRDLSGNLRYISLLNINLGIKRAGISDYHWIYFPEAAYPFYRVGFPSILSPHMAPEGTSSLSVEISLLPTVSPSVEDAREQTLAALISCGLLRNDDEIVAERILLIKHAYVIYDRFRQQHLPQIFQFLHSRHIYPIGRYGLWGYTTMEDAILQGRDVARELS